MSRPRTIDQDDVLIAAEIVANRDGAANLTLEAVAAEVGISKASVIYDYGSKQSLIEAVIKRRLRIEEERIDKAVSAFAGAADAEILGRIAAAAEKPMDCDSGAAAALNLCLLLKQGDLHELMQEFQSRQVGAVLENAGRPRQAIIAMLALEGLKAFEYFDFYAWSPEERGQILEDITALVREKRVVRVMRGA